MVLVGIRPPWSRNARSNWLRWFAAAARHPSAGDVVAVAEDVQGHLFSAAVPVGAAPAAAGRPAPFHFGSPQAGPRAAGRRRRGGREDWETRLERS